jgi:hypothetical protein
MLTPLMAIDTVTAGIETKVRRLVNQDAMPERRRTGQTGLAATVRQFPGYRGRVKMS